MRKKARISPRKAMSIPRRLSSQKLRGKNAEYKKRWK